MKKTIYLILITLAAALQVTAQCWTKISAGGTHTLAIKNDGSLWAWGNNFGGQLGDGTTANSTVPVRVGTDNDWSSVFASSGYFSMALKSDGTLWAWGINWFGQLGNGTTANTAIPVQVGTDNNWQIISPGNEYVLATKTNGTLWAWGVNNVAQLGNGSYVNISSPEQIGTDTDWTLVDAGFETSMALKANGSIWAWGNNFNGIFGNGTTGTSSNVPILVSATNDWSTFNASAHVMAKKTDGSLWAWGYNADGQLGDGTATNGLSPVQIGTDLDWDTVIAGGNYTLALKNDATIWHWGNNTFGQYGNGTWFPTSLVPLQNPLYTDWESISVTDATAFGIRTGSNLWGWGSGSFGNIGNGSTINSNTPQTVSCIVILPVTWLYATAVWKNNTALIKWATASESNTSRFEIEHSIDGYIYSAIGTAAAAGSSSGTQRYEFLHNNPVDEKNYYRIKQVDRDGRFTYSSVIILNSNQRLLTTISPNPVIQNTTIRFSKSAAPSSITLLNANGQTVLQQAVKAGSSTAIVEMHRLPAGIYYLQLHTAGNIETQKIIKQ